MIHIDCGYTLEPPGQSGSNEYTQSMFLSKHKKNRYTPAYPSFKVGFKGVFVAWTCFPDVSIRILKCGSGIKNRKVQVRNDQEKAQSKKIPTPKTEAGKSQTNNKVLIP